MSERHDIDHEATARANAMGCDVVMLRMTPEQEIEVSRATIARQEREIERLRITSEERKAIKTMVGGFGMWVAQNDLTDDESLRRAVVTMRGLMERLDDHRTPAITSGEEETMSDEKTNDEPSAASAGSIANTGD